MPHAAPKLLALCLALLGFSQTGLAATYQYRAYIPGLSGGFPVVTPPPPSMSWLPQAWSTCSQSCGPGTQTRVVTCADSQGATVPDSNCTGTAPDTTQSCQIAACPTENLYVWGLNSTKGQLGQGDTASRSTPTLVATGKTYSKVALAVDFSYANQIAVLALATDGTLWHWGNNAMGWNGSAADGAAHPTPTPILTSLGPWKDVAMGSWQAKAITSGGALWEWAYTYAPSAIGTPRQVGTATDWLSVATSTGASAARKANGTYQWGRIDSGMVSNTGALCGLAATGTPTLSTAWKSVSLPSSGTMTYGIDASNNLSVCGGYYYDASTATSRYAYSQLTLIPGPVIQVSMNRDSCAMAVKSDGSLWYTSTRLGTCNGVYGINSTPTRVGTDNDWKMVAVGGDFSIAIKQDGSLWAWGGNAAGQLGLGDNVSRAIPTRVGSDTDWASVYAEGGMAAALKR